MGFPEPGRSVNEQRVVRTSRTLGDGQGGRVREPVGRTDDELVERVPGIERRGPRCRGLDVGGAGRVLGSDRCRHRRQRVEGHRVFITGGSGDEELDGVRHTRQRLGGIGEQAEVTRADPLDGDGTRHPEDKGVVTQVERVDTLKPGVPRRFRELGPHRCCDLHPQVVCRWSPQVPLPRGFFHRPFHMSTCPQTWDNARQRKRPWPRSCSGPYLNAVPDIGLLGKLSGVWVVRNAGMGDVSSALWTSQPLSPGLKAACTLDCCSFRPRRTLFRPLACPFDLFRRTRLAPRGALPRPHPHCRGVFEEAMREKDVPAQQPEAEEEARLPTPDAHPGRPGGHRPPALEGSRAPLRLIWRIRDRSSFRALAAGRRRRRGVLVVTTAVVGTVGDPPRVAYAVDRRLGSAVTRNSVRRRLRVAAREQAGLLEADHAYVVRALPGAEQTPLRDLSGTLRELLDGLAREERGHGYKARHYERPAAPCAPL